MQEAPKSDIPQGGRINSWRKVEWWESHRIIMKGKWHVWVAVLWERCDKDAITHREWGEPLLLGLYPYSICTVGTRARRHKPAILSCGTTWSKPADCLHCSVSHTTSCYGTPWLRRAHVRQKKVAIIDTWRVERNCLTAPQAEWRGFLAQIATLFWPCHSIWERGDLERERERRCEREEVKMMREHGGWEEDGRVVIIFHFLSSSG